MSELADMLAQEPAQTDILKWSQRNVYLSSDVRANSIASVSSRIIQINEQDEEIENLFKVYYDIVPPRPAINFYIDSYGGYIDSALGLIGVITTSATPVDTIVTGIAASAAFAISISGSKRYAYENSSFLCHQASTFVYGELKTVEEQLEITKKYQKRMEEHTKKYTKIPEEKLVEIYEKKKDFFFFSDEALELGVIDEIIQ